MRSRPSSPSLDPLPTFGQAISATTRPLRPDSDGNSVASTSTLPPLRRPRTRSRRRVSSLGVRSTSGTDCWCGGRGSRTTGGLVTLGTLASVLAAVPLASASPVFPRDAAAAAAAAFPPTLPLHPDPSSPRATATPSSQLSPSTPFAPTPTPPRPSSTQNPFLAPSPPQLGKRAVARLEEIGGWWLDSTAWSLNGRSGGFATATSSPLVDAKDSQDKKLGVIATTTRDAYKTATILADNTAAETSSSIDRKSVV